MRFYGNQHPVEYEYKWIFWNWNQNQKELLFFCPFLSHLYLTLLFSSLFVQPVTSSDIQILLHPPNIKGVMLECHSGGWFPLPLMEWRDSKGEVIPETSKSHSRDGNKLFNMTMALLINTSSHWNVTCYLQNRLTQQEECINIVLSGKICICSSVKDIVAYTNVLLLPWLGSQCLAFSWLYSSSNLLSLLLSLMCLFSQFIF